MRGTCPPSHRVSFLPGLIAVPPVRSNASWLRLNGFARAIDTPLRLIYESCSGAETDPRELRERLTRNDRSRRLDREITGELVVADAPSRGAEPGSANMRPMGVAREDVDEPELEEADA